MSKMELTILMILPVFIIVLSLISIHTANELTSLATEMESRSNDAAKLVINWKKFGVTDNEKIKELASLNEKTISSVQNVYNEFSDISTNLAEVVTKYYYHILFLSLFNIYLIVILYRKYKNAAKNL
jgi:predicted PurR-regulated permease PerM